MIKWCKALVIVRMLVRAENTMRCTDKWQRSRRVDGLHDEAVYLDASVVSHGYRTAQATSDGLQDQIR
jgi:hypothetical protein